MELTNIWIHALPVVCNALHALLQAQTVLLAMQVATLTTINVSAVQGFISTDWLVLFVIMHAKPVSVVPLLV